MLIALLGKPWPAKLRAALAASGLRIAAPERAALRLVAIAVSQLEQGIQQVALIFHWLSSVSRSNDLNVLSLLNV